MFTNIRKQLSSPYSQFVLFLVVLSACAIINTPQAITSLVVILIVSFMLTKIIEKFITQKKKMKLSILATSLIFFLVWNPTNDLTGHLLTAFLVAFVIIYKYFGQIKGMSIFNPAALALLLGSLISQSGFFDTNTFVSWWGTDFGGGISLVIILCWCIFGLRKWGKLPLALSFFLTFIAVTFFKNSDIAIFNLTHSTLYFAAGVMLIDPKSSPLKKYEQIYYGALTAILYVGLELQEFTYAILLLNLMYFIRTQVKLGKTKAKDV